MATMLDLLEYRILTGRRRRSPHDLRQPNLLQQQMQSKGASKELRLLNHRQQRVRLQQQKRQDQRPRKWQSRTQYHLQMGQRQRIQHLHNQQLNHPPSRLQRQAKMQRPYSKTRRM